MSIAERTPEAILDFWLGPMRTIADTKEDNWRNGMLKWRVGVFAPGLGRRKISGGAARMVRTDSP